MTEHAKRLELWNTLDLETKLRIARYAYKVGNPIMHDSEYDILYKQLPESSALRFVSWENDKIDDIVQLLVEYGVYTGTPETKSIGVEIEESEVTKLRNELRNYWGTNKSIQLVKTIGEFLTNYLQQILDAFTAVELILSYKMDGWNITAYYIPDQEDVFYAHTRGRATDDVIDCTRLMQLLLPKLKVDKPTRVVGELCIKKPYLEVLRFEYPERSFNNARNSVASYINKTIDIEKHYIGATFFTFAYDEYDSHNNLFTKVKDMYKFLENNGFTTPFYTLVEDVNNLGHEYAKMEDFYKTAYKEEYMADGLVCQPNDISVAREVVPFIPGSYSEGLVAMKTGYWSEQVYESTINKIFYGRNSVNLLVEPIKTDMGTITRVPLNKGLRTVQRYWLQVGDKVKISYHSGQIVKFLHKITEDNIAAEEYDLD